SELADRSQILLPDRQSAELAAAARKDNPNAINALPLEYIDETLQFHPEWVVDKIAPRPILFITTDDDRLVPPEESQTLFDKAGEPKSLIVLRGFGHYEFYTDPAFSQVMAQRFPGSSGSCRPAATMAVLRCRPEGSGCCPSSVP